MATVAGQTQNKSVNYITVLEANDRYCSRPTDCCLSSPIKKLSSFNFTNLTNKVEFTIKRALKGHIKISKEGITCTYTWYVII